MISLFTLLFATQIAITLAIDCVEDQSYRAPSMDPGHDSKKRNCKWIKAHERRRSAYCTLAEVHQACPITCGECCADNEGFKFEGRHKAIKSCSFLNNDRKKKRFCNRDSLIGYNCASSCTGHIKMGMDSCPPYVSDASSPSAAPSVASSNTPTSEGEGNLCDDSFLINELEHLISLYDPVKLLKGENNLKKILDAMMHPDYILSEIETEAITHFGIQKEISQIKKYSHYLLEYADKGAVELCKAVVQLGAASGKRDSSRRLKSYSPETLLKENYKALSFWSSFADVFECAGAVLGTGAACSVGEVFTAGADTAGCVGAATATTGLIADKTS